MLTTVGNLRVQSPIAQGGLTAVGFHGSERTRSSFSPWGRRRTKACSPASGTGSPGARVAACLVPAREWGAAHPRRRRRRGDRRLLPGRRHGRRDPRPARLGTRRRGADRAPPSAAPSLVVSLENVRPDRALSVGANVAAGSSKLGRVADIARYERQALARFATDRGNNVSIQVYPSASLGVR